MSSAAKAFRQACIQRKRRYSPRDLQRFCGRSNSTNLAVTYAQLHLRALFNCAGAAQTSRRVILCHKSLRDLEWWGNLPQNQHFDRAIWDPIPTATLITEASMEGWGAIMHTSGRKGPATPLQWILYTNPLGPGMQGSTGSSVPARGLFTPADAEPRSINQRELLAAIL
jgi:hypothetical protein